jgi:hypothetical protein
MEQVIKSQNLENLLLKNWANFLDTKKVMAFTLTCVRDSKNDFNIIVEEESLPKKNVQIIVTRFNIKHDGFQLWIDFTVPEDNEILVGTVEAHLSNNGNLNRLRTIGTRFTQHLGS